MSQIHQFLPWSGGSPGHRKLKPALRPAPAVDQRLISWDSHGQPRGLNYDAFDSNSRRLKINVVCNGHNCPKRYAVSALRPGHLTVGLGCSPDQPDRRDFSPEKLRSHIETVMGAKPATKKRSRGQSFLLAADNNLLPKRVHVGDRIDSKSPSRLLAAEKRINLGEKRVFSPVEDQLDLNSCTANAVVGMVEYLQLVHTGRFTDMSRLFLYKTSRRLLNWNEDDGCTIRATIQALRLFGLPPESEWPYDPHAVNTEPDQFTYAYASNFKAAAYASLDLPGSNLPDVIDRVKSALADGFPVAFGFTIHESITRMENWTIPFPTGENDQAIGGHAVLAVGYDDSIEYTIPDPDPLKAEMGETITKHGALIIRNSWGISWGDLGYGYLPYHYVEMGLAQDFWTLYSTMWAKSAQFDVAAED